MRRVTPRDFSQAERFIIGAASHHVHPDDKHSIPHSSSTKHDFLPSFMILGGDANHLMEKARARANKREIPKIVFIITRREGACTQSYLYHIQLYLDVPRV
jgi:hypothetical protein